MDYKVPIGGKWKTWTSKDLEKWGEGGQEDVVRELDRIHSQYCDNKLSRFLPHGDGLEFINNRIDGICMLTALNQVGKSVHGCIFSATRIIPCDPEWPIFTENGVEYHEWDGPKKWIVASSSWENVGTVWECYREFLPRKELGAYAADWPRIEEGESGTAKNLSFGDGRRKRLKLACGTELIFLCYSQGQMPWEGFQADGAHFDEQIPEDKFTGYSARTITRGDDIQCCVTLTGHVVKDREGDTGAGGFCHKIWTGAVSTSFTVWRGSIGLPDVPDEIVSKSRKAKLKKEWVDDPKKRHDIYKLRQAEARYWGRWEQSSGLMFDLWIREIHVIPPLWRGKPAPPNATLYRTMDYGDPKPTVCLWIAMFPDGNQFHSESFAVMYREYYEPGKLIAQSAPEIIEASGNRRIFVNQEKDEETGNTFEIYEEIEDVEQYEVSLLDPRSFAQSQQNQEIGYIFGRYGLFVSQATGPKESTKIQMLKDFLYIDPKNKHIVTGEMGAPRLYITEDCQEFIDEIEALRSDPADSSKIAKKQDDHAVDALKYWAAYDPIVVDRLDDEDKDEYGSGEFKYEYDEEYEEQGMFK